MIDLRNEDCLKVLKELSDNSIDLVVTDPPYRVTARGSGGSMGGYWTSKIAMSGNIFENNDIPCKEYLPEFYRILKDRTHCYVMCNNTNLVEMITTGIECGFSFVKCLIWQKPNAICGRYYMNCFEYIILFRKGGDRSINDCGTPDILNVPLKKLKDDEGNNYHDTEKPVELMEILIENSTNEGDTVLDPFMGIGASGVASKQLRRNFIGIEIDKKYFDIAKQRIDEGIIKSKLEQNSLWEM